jgi:hypothetical protein
MRRPLACLLLLIGCDSSSPDTPDAGPEADADLAPACALTANTTPTDVVNEGCAVLERDTTACEADRRAAGLSGFWLRFSCRVTLTKPTADTVQLASDGLPDHTSNYFAASDPCHDNFTPEKNNPNELAPHSLRLTLLAHPQPTAIGTAMNLGTIGMAINGVALFSNRAAGDDDIYIESEGFDRCHGHPTGRDQYHYHTEPWSVSVDDDHFIGVFMDGFAVYGRRDPDGSIPTDLDQSGGHTGVTLDSTTPVYHHHVNFQTSSNTATGTAGKSEWFMSTGFYSGPVGQCVGCP